MWTRSFCRFFINIKLYVIYICFCSFSIFIRFRESHSGVFGRPAVSGIVSCRKSAISPALPLCRRKKGGNDPWPGASNSSADRAVLRFSPKNGNRLFDCRECIPHTRLLSAGMAQFRARGQVSYLKSTQFNGKLYLTTVSCTKRSSSEVKKMIGRAKYQGDGQNGC